MLKPYMLFSRFLGSEEGALLCFAHSVREARAFGWANTSGFDVTDDYLDFAARLIKNSDWIYKNAIPEKLANDEPHVILDPEGCVSCEQWGHSEIGVDGLCDDCRMDAIRDKASEKYDFENIPDGLI